MKAVVSVLLLWTSAVHSFITVPLDYNNPYIKDAFCPSRTTASLKYSKYLTREAIRLEVRQLMMEEPPEGNIRFFIPEDASLPSMYRMYYGETSSPTRFVKAVNSIAWANAEVDTSPYTKYDPRYHFDAERIQEGQALLAARHNSIVSSIRNNQSYSYARIQLGMSLHGIQDFYSHTSWIELKNTNILEGLGLPGLTIPNVAGPDDITCRSCDMYKGDCSKNVIAHSKLTSGYYEINLLDNKTSRPSNPHPAKGKCSFGGAFNISRANDPTGGINKDSPSICFSPHYHLHEEAADLAIKASQSYLATIRETIGNTHFRKLLDIYDGSALVVVMDTTGSMGGEIAGVKEEVKKIVASVNPEVYVLVPFSDPGFGPAGKVGDGKEFISLLDLLKAKGGGDIPEMSWSGLQLALSVTPDYSTLYLFTDAVGKDEHLYNSVLLLAQWKHITVTVVYTDSSPSDLYRQLAEMTGGKLIEIGKETFDRSVPIIQSGVENSKVTITKRIFGDKLEHTIHFPVDDTITELKILTEGDLSLADLKSPTGKLYHLMDDDAAYTEDFTIQIFSDTLKAFYIQDPEKGMWEANVYGLSTFELTIKAASILGCLVEITEFDPLPPRPGYGRIAGRPLEGLEYHVEVMLVGWSDTGVKNVTTMKLLSMNGSEISEVTYGGVLRDEIFIKTNPLIDEPFYLSFSGYLNSENAFTRLFPTVITPVTVLVDSPSSNSITGVAGSEVYITVLVTNRAGADSFINGVVDSKGYSHDETVTDEAVIEPNETRAIVISFKIPEDEETWSVSEVVITATAKSKKSNVNSQVAYLMVIPKVCFRKDGVDAPQCYRLASPTFSLKHGEAQALALSALSAVGESGHKTYLECSSGKCADDKMGAPPCTCEGTKLLNWIGHLLLLQVFIVITLN